MGNLNKVMIIGRTGGDAELRYTANGIAVSNFSVAVNSYRRSAQGSGEWDEETEWFRVTLFGDRAERDSQYITKGKQLYVEGRLRTSSWDDDQGVRRYRTEVIANRVEFLDRRRESGNDWGESEGGSGNNWAGGDMEQTSSNIDDRSFDTSAWPPAEAGRHSKGAPSNVDDLPFE